MCWSENTIKTIGNRKGHCAWSCSRWQTQPEKICKSQRTNQCHSLRTLYWFVLCNLQIFSGCVCHLEQLQAQSPFLFPIGFRFLFSIFAQYLLSFHPVYSGMCCLGAALLGPRARGRNSFRLWFWQLVFRVSLRDATSNLPSSPTPSQTVCSTMGESIHVRPSSRQRSFFIVCSENRHVTTPAKDTAKHRYSKNLHWVYSTHPRIRVSCLVWRSDRKAGEVARIVLPPPSCYASACEKTIWLPYAHLILEKNCTVSLLLKNRPPSLVFCHARLFFGIAYRQNCRRAPLLARLSQL